jgi:DNA replication protein DnaC
MKKNNKITESLQENLKTLRLAHMNRILQECALMAQQESLSYEEYLLYLTEEELAQRRLRRIDRLRKQSQLPLEKTFQTFDLNRLPRSLRQQISTIRNGTFTTNRENVLVFGSQGSGKTHVMCAIGHELIEQGQHVYYSTCALLVQELLYAKRQLTLPSHIKKLSKYDAIIIDDIGYVQQNREEMEVLFTLLAERYERGSIMLTSNLPFSKWELIFKDPLVTAAAIDRLVHHGTIIELNLESYRMLKAKERKGGQKKNT